MYYSYDGNLSVGQGKECEHLFRVCRSKVMLFSSSNWSNRSKCSLYLTTVKFCHLKFILEYCHVDLIYFASCYIQVPEVSMGRMNVEKVGRPQIDHLFLVEMSFLRTFGRGKFSMVLPFQCKVCRTMAGLRMICQAL